MSTVQHRSVAGRARVFVPHVTREPKVGSRLRSWVAPVLAVGALLAVIAVSVVVPGTAEKTTYPPHYAPHGGLAGPALRMYSPYYAPHGGLAGPALRMYSPYYAPIGGFAGPSR